MYEITFAVNGNITADNEFGKYVFIARVYILACILWVTVAEGASVRSLAQTPWF